jgi:hypothetical protein
VNVADQRSEILGKLKEAADDLGARVAWVRRAALEIQSAIEEVRVPMFQSAKLNQWMDNGRNFLRGVEDMRALDSQASDVVRRAAFMENSARSRKASDLGVSLGRLTAYLRAFFAPERFLGDLEVLEHIDGSPEVARKQAALDDANAQINALQPVMQFLWSPLGLIAWPADETAPLNDAVKSARDGLIAILVDRFAAVDVAQRLQTLQKAAGTEKDSQAAVANVAQAQEQESAKKKQQVEQASAGLRRAEAELSGWQRTCANDLVDAEGQETVQETLLALQDYRSHNSETPDPEASASWVARFKKLSARWSAGALRSANQRVQTLEGELEFCRAAGMPVESGAEMGRLKRPGFSSFSDYAGWKAECAAFQKKLDDLVESEQISSLSWTADQCKPLASQAAALLGQPLLSEQRERLADIRNRIEQLTGKSSSSLPPWQQLVALVRAFGEELQAVKEAVAAFRKELEGRRRPLSEKLAALSEAIAGSGMDVVTVTVTAEDLVVEKDLDHWDERLTKVEKQLRQEQARVEAIFTAAITALTARAKPLRAVVPKAFEASVDQSTSQNTADLGRRVALLRATIKSAEEACVVRLGGLRGTLQEAIDRQGELQSEDGGGIRAQDLAALAREGAELTAMVESSGASEPVMLLLRFDRWMADLQRVEGLIRGKNLQAGTALVEIRAEMLCLREEGLGGFPGAVLPECWDWIESCCKGAEDARDIVVSWGAGVEAQLQRAKDECNSLGKHARRFEGEQFWRRLRDFDRMRLEKNRSGMRRQKSDEFQMLRPQFSPAQLPSLQHRTMLRELVP